jgi:enamine deaminase RidA (YjgF/YER057c/UK114 family)
MAPPHIPPELRHIIESASPLGNNPQTGMQQHLTAIEQRQQHALEHFLRVCKMRLHP